MQVLSETDSVAAELLDLWSRLETVGLRTEPEEPKTSVSLFLLSLYLSGEADC